MTTARKRALAALAIWLAYTGLIALANLFAHWAGGDDTSPWMAASGITMGVFAVPVFSIVLPIWLGRRWRLPVSWWPRRAEAPLALAAILAFVTIASADGLGGLADTGLTLGGFALHFTSAALFHVTYYPLFLILLLGTWRAVLGLVPAMVATAAAFASYHLAQFHFFPAGTGAGFLGLLFVTFLVSQTLYLVTRSLMLVALAHCLNGAVGLARAGTLFTTMDFLFWLDLVLLAGLFAWSGIEKRRPGRDGAVWLALRPADDSAPVR